MTEKLPEAMPHGPIQEVFPNIWFVEGKWIMPVPGKPTISRSMIVVRDKATGDLTLVNSMRLSEEGLSKLESLGQIRHVIRLATMHGADDGFYKDRYGATIYALEGTTYQRGLSPKSDPAKSYFKPDS